MAVNFSSPPDPNYYKARVWEVVRLIPEGQVATYGQIAALIPPPEGMGLSNYRALGARWVGGAMAASPEGVPWQRVINSQGRISLRGSSSDRQRELLEEEGVEFDDRDRVDLKRFGWAGPDSDWLRSHGLLQEQR